MGGIAGPDGWDQRPAVSLVLQENGVSALHISNLLMPADVPKGLNDFSKRTQFYRI